MTSTLFICLLTGYDDDLHVLLTLVLLDCSFLIYQFSLECLFMDANVTVKENAEMYFLGGNKVLVNAGYF